MNQRSRGKPRILTQFGGPVPPDDIDHDDDGHGDDGGERWHLSSIAAAPPGWVARYSRGDIPLVAFAIVEVICDHGHIADTFTESLVLPIGAKGAPVPACMYEGDEGSDWGAFLGFFPTTA